MSISATPVYETVAIHPLVEGKINPGFPLNADKRVLVTYTGGTIGSKSKDPDPDSPQVVPKWEELAEPPPEIERPPFPVNCVALVNPLDSCNVGPAEWARFAQIIQEHYEKYQGFVVLHGTDTSAQLVEAGLVAAYDITPQAAHAKLMHLLGMSDLDQEEVEERFQRSLVGEQSRSIWLAKLPGKGTATATGYPLPNEASVYRIKGKEMRGSWKNTQIVTASLRLKNATFTCPGEDEIRLWVLPNWDTGLPLAGAHAVIRRSVSDKQGLAILDVTSIVRAIAQPNSNISFTLAPVTPDAQIEWDGAELALVIDETIS